jgi:CDP-diacylglycerol--serine O-phosphatidyltransferase
VVLVLLLAVLYWRGATGDDFWLGRWDWLGRVFHPFAALYVVSGSLMISTVRVPKP